MRTYRTRVPEPRTREQGKEGAARGRKCPYCGAEHDPEEGDMGAESPDGAKPQDSSPASGTYPQVS